MSRPPKAYAIRLRIALYDGSRNGTVIIDTHPGLDPSIVYGISPGHIVWGFASIPHHIASLLQSWAQDRTGECPPDILAEALATRAASLRTMLSQGQGWATWRGGFQLRDGAYTWQAAVTSHVPEDILPERKATAIHHPPAAVVYPDGTVRTLEPPRPEFDHAASPVFRRQRPDPATLPPREDVRSAFATPTDPAHGEATAG